MCFCFILKFIVMLNIKIYVVYVCLHIRRHYKLLVNKQKVHMYLKFEIVTKIVTSDTNNKKAIQIPDGYKLQYTSGLKTTLSKGD